MDWRRVAFYRWSGDNLGDRPLNDWIVRRWFPDLPAAPVNPAVVLLCVGSVLGHRSGLPPAWRDLPWLIYGSGFQYGRLDVPPGSTAFAYRGRWTRDRVAGRAADRTLALADPAILLPLYLPRDVASEPDHVGVVWKWDRRGPETDREYTTRVRDDLVGWARRLWRHEYVLTDSLHAALLADAYGIPWRPLRWEPKWADAFERLGIRDRPTAWALSDRTLLAARQAELETARLALIAHVAALPP